MTATTARANAFLRVPHRIVQDPRFELIYDDDAALATWLRMTLQADASWPVPAVLPQIAPSIIEALTGAGLIELAPHGTFRVPDQDAERSKIVEAAAGAGLSSVKRAVRDDHGHFAPRTNTTPTAVGEPCPTAVGEPVQRPSNGPSNGHPTTKTETETKVPVPVAGAAPSKGWGDGTWGPEWQPLRVAFEARGFRKPPTPRQREMLWPIVSARPRDAGRWAEEAPAELRSGTPGAANELIGYVLTQWDAFRAARRDGPKTAPPAPSVVARIISDRAKAAPPDSPGAAALRVAMTTTFGTSQSPA
jgi:hypothetical protein